MMTTQILKDLRMAHDDDLMTDGVEAENEEESLEDADAGSSDITNDEEEEEEF